MKEKFEMSSKSVYEEEAEKIIGDIEQVLEGKKGTDFIDSNGFSDLDKLFLERAPAVKSETEGNMVQLEAENSVLNTVDQKLSVNEKRSHTEELLLEKLAEYFRGLPSRSEHAERVETSIAFLEKIPTKSSVEFLSALAQSPEMVVWKTENKYLRRETVGRGGLRELIKEGEAAESEEEAKNIIRAYYDKLVKPQAMRGAIKLKQQMNIELTEDEQVYYNEHPEKF